MSLEKKIHRIYSLIPHLNYTTLRKKILPKKALFTGIKIGGNFPSVAKNIGYPQFGLFVDHLIQRKLAKKYNLPCDYRNMTKYELYVLCNDILSDDTPIEKKRFKCVYPWCKITLKTVTKWFVNSSDIYLEPEWIWEDIMGHPDLVVDNVVYDIKTTGKFGSMRKLTIFQLLSYYCLAQQLGKNIDSIGLILPAQSKILTVNMSGWDWRPFWTALKGCIPIKISLQPDPLYISMYREVIYPYVGYHISKDRSIYHTLLNVPTHLPYQMFLSGRCRANVNISDANIAKTLDLIENKEYRLYIHAPYTLNISREEKDGWTIDKLSQQLRVAKSIGCRGVVVHCGVKKKGMEQELAYTNMYNGVINVAEYGSEECPLLVETSAGETGELLSNPEELIAFYNSLPEEIKKVVKICVDTCHVFVAGYHPMYFIQELERCDVPIGLIHYNNSKGPKGCRKDRHAKIESGYIPLEELILVGRYAIDNEIDMIRE